MTDNKDTKTGADGNAAQGAQPKDQSNGASAEVQVAEQQGISEGEVKALRDDAGLDQSAGHEANVHAWESSASGQQFLKDEGKRQKAIKEEAKTVDEQTDKDGLDPAAAKYIEVVTKGRKTSA